MDSEAMKCKSSGSKHIKKRTKRKREHSSSSSSSEQWSEDSSDSSDYHRHTKKKKKHSHKEIKLKKRDKKKHSHHHDGVKKKKKKLSVSGKRTEVIDSATSTSSIPPHPLVISPGSSCPGKPRGPMTREEYEKQQSVVRRVFDPDTGRHRLVKGDGEIIEEIVSKDRHKAINKLATLGDGLSFQSQLRKLQ